MQRLRRQLDAEPIGEALSRLPDGIAGRLRHVQFFAGVDPVFAGLTPVEDCSFGRSYRDTAHVCYPVHLTHRPAADRVTTVALPVPVEPVVAVHELGHALHEAIGFDCHVPDPVSDYATTNEWEAFAEAFTAWLCPLEYRWAQDRLRRDEQTLRLFEELAAA